MTKHTTSSPQNRGLIAAVAIFAIAVLAGVSWIVNRGESIDSTAGELQALIPESVMRNVRRSTPTASDETADAEDSADIEYKLRLRQKRGAIVGKPRILRGDLIQIDRQVVRLLGIDEIRGYKHCSPNTFGWPCGTSSADALGLMIGNRKVACEPKGHNAQGETVAICHLGDSDIAAEMLLRGMAVNVTDRFDYNLKQRIAKSDNVGYWHTADR